LSSNSPELTGKRLEILKEAFPRIAQAAALWQPGGGGESASHKAMIDHAESAARALAIELRVLEVATAADIEPAFSATTRQRMDAFTVLGTPMFFLERARW
jgi:hypothetical protein